MTSFSIHRNCCWWAGGQWTVECFSYKYHIGSWCVRVCVRVPAWMCLCTCVPAWMYLCTRVPTWMCLCTCVPACICCVYMCPCMDVFVCTTLYYTVCIAECIYFLTLRPHHHCIQYRASVSNGTHPSMDGVSVQESCYKGCAVLWVDTCHMCNDH